MKTKGFGIRGLFRIAILAVVASAYMAFVSVSYTNVTADEHKRAEASIRSEVNYLCLQLESLGKRADAFVQIADSKAIDPKELGPANSERYRLLSDHVGDVLAGYTLAETGTVAIIADGTVVATDDGRVPVGSDVKALLGDEVCNAIDVSLQEGQMQSIPYCGVFDEAGGPGAYGDGDD